MSRETNNSFLIFEFCYNFQILRPILSECLKGLKTFLKSKLYFLWINFSNLCSLRRKYAPNPFSHIFEKFVAIECLNIRSKHSLGIQDENRIRRISSRRIQALMLHTSYFPSLSGTRGHFQEYIVRIYSTCTRRVIKELAQNYATLLSKAGIPPALEWTGVPSFDLSLSLFSSRHIPLEFLLIVTLHPPLFSTLVHFPYLKCRNNLPDLSCNQYAHINSKNRLNLWSEIKK